VKLREGSLSNKAKKKTMNDFEPATTTDLEAADRFTYGFFDDVEEEIEEERESFSEEDERVERQHTSFLSNYY